MWLFECRPRVLGQGKQWSLLRMQMADPKDSDDLYCIQLIMLPGARRYDNALVLSMVSPKCLCVRLYNLDTHWEVMQNLPFTLYRNFLFAREMLRVVYPQSGYAASSSKSC